MDVRQSPPTGGGGGAPYVRILEQPARCALRFRYECEGRSAGSIPGANSTGENKTFPTIQVVNYTGQAVVVVSCVTKDAPYRPHPHNLVGKEGCKKGVCTMVINNPDMICSFTSLGIQCVKRKDVEDSLKLRESIKVDPFRTGFSHKNQASNIDLNVVRLCFQVFIEGPEKDKYTVPLPPVVCEAIFDKKAMSDLIITKLSHCSSPASGGKEVILLCDRVTKDDVQVRFFEELNGLTAWEAFGDFQPNDVHKQVAISFRTPKYRDENIIHPVTVQMQLRRPSDGHVSESRTFIFHPRPEDHYGLTRKRQKMDESAMEYLVASPSPITFTTAASPVGMQVTSGAVGGAIGGQPLSPIPPPQPTVVSTAAFHTFSPPTEYVRVPRFTPKVKSDPIPLTVNQAVSISSGGQGTGETLQSTAQWTISPSHLPPLPQNQATVVFSDLQSISVKKEPLELSGGYPVQHQQSQQPQTQGLFSKPDQPTANSNNQGMANNTNNSLVEGPLSEKFDSLDLLDPNDLMNDLNFNNLMVNLDSGNNITFNSSGNITTSNLAGGNSGNGNSSSGYTALNTPLMDTTTDSNKNPLAFMTQNDLSRRD